MKVINTRTLLLPWSLHHLEHNNSEQQVRMSLSSGDSRKCLIAGSKWRMASKAMWSWSFRVRQKVLAPSSEASTRATCVGAYVREVEAKYYIIVQILRIVQMAISLCGSQRILLYIQATLYLHWTLQPVRVCHRGRYTTVYDVSANSVMWLSSTYSMCCQNFLPQNLDMLVFRNIKRRLS